MLRLLKSPDLDEKFDLPREIRRSAKRLERLDETLGLDLSERSPERALVVCSERTSRKWAPRWLKQLGFDVDLATTGARARFFIEAKAPTLVIVEAAMRDTDGGRVYSALLKSLDDEGPSVVVVGAGRGDVVEATAQGAVDVSRRPIDWRLVSRRAAVIAASRRAGEAVDRARKIVGRALDELRSTRELLERKADVDSLTGLPNRRVFTSVLQRAFSAPRPAGSEIAVLYLDIDNFGSINECAGRDCGDEILRAMSRRLTRCFESAELMSVRTTGLVSASLARIGGDEFALMISNVSSTEHLKPLFERFTSELSQPYEVCGSKYYVSTSFGGAMYPSHGQTAEEVLHHAELAMLEAKEMGGGVQCYYDPSLNEKANQRVSLGRDLRQALERDELALHYQPLIDRVSGKVTAVEALLRWRHPERGLLLPDDFLSVAESEALMVPIGRWVLREACRQLREWMDAGVEPVRMLVNVAHRQLTHGDLPREVEESLSASGLDPRLLELELSERGFLGHGLNVLAALRKLSRLGVSLAIDDFGTGESAIVYLKQLPIDALKIDRSYVSGGGDGEGNATIGSAMVAMAHGLGLKVVAEGVETPERKGVVEAGGCDELQGFLFSSAVAGDQVPRLLNDLNTGTHSVVGREAK